MADDELEAVCLNSVVPMCNHILTNIPRSAGHVSSSSSSRAAEAAEAEAMAKMRKGKFT
jgi:hypothetical protein